MSRWLKTTTFENNWHKGLGDKTEELSVMIRFDDVVAMREISEDSDNGNRTTIFVRASGMDGWLEINVAETISQLTDSWIE